MKQDFQGGGSWKNGNVFNIAVHFTIWGTRNEINMESKFKTLAGP